MRGYAVCASHGGKAGEASKAIMAAPYDPAAAFARKIKRDKHRAYARLRNSGQAPTPVKESWRLFEQRVDREQRAVRQRMETTVERMFHERTLSRRPSVQRSTLYGSVVEEDQPTKPLRPLYPC
jgi:hypothetical protein